MEKIKLILFIFLFGSCKVKDIKFAQDKPSKKIIINKDSCRLVYLFSDGFLKNSYIGITQNSILFIHGDITYKHLDYYSKKLLFFDSTNKAFKYLTSIYKHLPDDSLKLLRKNNIVIKSVLKEAKTKESPYYKELLQNERLKSKIAFLEKDSRIKKFNNKYYIIDRIYNDSLYQVDLVTQKVEAFYLGKDILYVLEFLLCDLDKDGNPEIIFFHDSDVPQGDRLMYDVYSIRTDSVKMDIDMIR